MPSLGLHIRGHPGAVGCLAASQHPWLMAGAQLVEVVLLALGGLAWTDAIQQDPCLLLSVAFGESHVLIRLDPAPPSQSSYGSDIPAASSHHTTVAACQGGQPQLGKAAGNLRSKILSALQIKELGFWLCSLSFCPRVPTASLLPARHLLRLVGISIWSSTGPAAQGVPR